MSKDYIQDWKHYLEIAEKFKSAEKIYRGQADVAWPLRPSLTRVFKEENVDREKAIRIEKELLDFFQSTNSDEFVKKLNPNNRIMWWTIMQHFGVPTRLLDWTTNIDVALYFAVNSEFAKDGALYFFDDGHLNFIRRIRKRKGAKWVDIDLQLEKSLSGEDYETSIYAFTIDLPIDRMENQQGCYTITTELTEDVEAVHDVIADKLAFDGVGGAENSSLLFRYLIKKSSKAEFLAQLRKIGITGQFLFPGLDGLGKTTTDLLHTLIAGFVQGE